MGTWIVARLKPGGLTVASINLKRQGYLVYSPAFRAQKLQAGKARQFLDPLFPGYLFVRALVPCAATSGDCDLPLWPPIRSTRGVASVLMRSHDTPAPIDESFIEELRARERAGAIDPATKYRRGQRIKISSGQFAGLDALYQTRASAADREIVLLSLLGRMTRVEIESADL